MHSATRLRLARRLLSSPTSTRSLSSLPPRPPTNLVGADGQPLRGRIVSDRLAKGTGEVPAAERVKESAAVAESDERRAEPTELLQVLEETIKTHGPLPVTRYMNLCLSHPTLGYYTTRKVFGKEGDFVTSPEISQVFGELLAIWFVTQWLAAGSPQKVRLIELGPGKGTLLADILRTFSSLPPASRPPVTSIHLVESSPLLRGIQATALHQVGAGSIRTKWYGDVKEVPEGERDEWTVLVAHEFFDALPVHVFEHTQKGWREVLIDVADSKAIPTPQTPPLRLVLSPTPTPASALYTTMAQLAYPSVAHQQSPTLESSAPTPRAVLSLNQKASVDLNVDTTLGYSPPPPSPSPSPSPQTTTPPTTGPVADGASLTAQRFARLPLGSRIEVSPASWEIARDVGKLVRGPEGGVGGAGLVVDYGDWKSFGRSWRGFRKHQVVDPLTEPGHTDLTANVDFSYLSEAMSEFATTHGPLPQSHFLTSLGLQPRLAALLRHASTDERRKEIESAAKRLVEHGGMGGQYRVMGITGRKGGEGREVVVGEGKRKSEVFPFDLE